MQTIKTYTTTEQQHADYCEFCGKPLHKYDKPYGIAEITKKHTAWFHTRCHKLKHQLLTNCTDC